MAKTIQMKSSMTFIQSNGCIEIDLIKKNMAAVCITTSSIKVKVNCCRILFPVRHKDTCTLMNLNKNHFETDCRRYTIICNYFNLLHNFLIVALYMYSKHSKNYVTSSQIFRFLWLNPYMWILYFHLFWFIWCSELEIEVKPNQIQ